MLSIMSSIARADRVPIKLMGLCLSLRSCCTAVAAAQYTKAISPQEFRGKEAAEPFRHVAWTRRRVQIQATNMGFNPHSPKHMVAKRLGRWVMQNPTRIAYRD